MANIGNLSFGIGGDDRELRKILEERKKDALELQKLFSSFNLGGKSQNSHLTEIVRNKEKLNRLEQSNLRLQETRDRVSANSLISQQRINQIAERTKAIQLQNLRLDNERITSQQRIRTEAERTTALRQRSAAEIARIESERINGERISNQRLLTEAQRTESARRRAALVGIQGQNNLNSAVWLTNKSLFNQKALLSQLSTQLGVYFSIYQVGAFVKELAMVSGEFEKQRLSLAAILQNKMAADRIFGQIKDLAVYSPFNFKELTDYSKQLSAFSIPTEELFDTMKRLADISAGLGVDMRRIILAYGQVRSAAVLRGQELRQFTEAGIPLVDELAKKFTKLNGEVISAGQVFDKISNREVPFAMIKEIFEDLTSEGGKFFNMQEIQATSLAGMISNLRDAYDIMLDSIGSANSELLKGTVGGLVEIMDNWERYWNILQSIIIGYGAYRAAIIASTIASQGLVKTIRTLTIVQTIFNSLSKINPYALAFAGLTALIGGLVTFINYQNEAKGKLLETITVINNHGESVNKSIDRLKELTKANEQDKAAEAERANIIAELAKKEPELAKSIKDHADNLEYLIAMQEKYNTLMDAQKFAKYAIAETGSVFTDGILENLESMVKAQNKADMLAISLDTAYTNLIESWKQVKDSGGFETLLGKVSVTPERMKQIDEILESQKSHAEKVLEVYSLVEYAGERAFNSSKRTGLGDANIAKGIFGDYKGKIQDYRQSLWDLQTISQTTNADLAALAKTLEVHFGYKGIDVFNPENKNMLREYVKNLEELGTYGQKEILSKWDIELHVNGQSIDTLEGWRKELRETLGSAIIINAESNFNDVVKEMKDKYKEVKSRMEEQKPILIKAKYDFDSAKFPENANESMKQVAEQFNLDKKAMEAIQAAGKLMGLTTTDLSPKSKGMGSNKDKFTEGLKEQAALIKEAKKQYEDLQKVISKEDAYKKLVSVAEYRNVKQEDITGNGYVAFIREQLKKIEGRNTDAARNVRTAWNKELGEIQIKRINENAQREIVKIEKYLSGYKEKYNQYKQLFEITGDKGQAAQMVFGDASTPVVTYMDTLKEKLKELSGGGIYEDLLKVDAKELVEPVRKIVEEIRQATQEQDFALSVDMAKIIADYATLEEKITAIHNQYEHKRAKAKNSGASQEEINKSIAAYDKAEQEAVAGLREELWQLTPFYRQLFGDLSDISYRHLKKMASDAKETVMQIAKTRVDANDENSRLKYGKYDRNGKVEGYYMPDQNGNISDVLINLKQYERLIVKIASIQKDMRKQNPFDSLLRPVDSYKIAEGTTDEKQMPILDVMASKVNDLNAIVQELSGSLSGMFDALGNESAAGATAFIGEMVGAVSNVAMGIASGNPVQVIQGIVGGITSIAKNHDKKLDRAIEKSKLKVKELQGAYSQLERFISRQLGAVTQSQAKQQIQNLEKQKKEIEGQMRNEKDKKKTDWGAVADYQNQINELSDRIRYFYEDLAGEQFGIKIKDWAKNISDALVDAWAKGEDAAAAFDKTVGEIMRSVFKNVLQLQYIEPAMARLRTYLFGNDGKGGVLGDGQMDKNDMNGLAKELMALKGGLKDWQKAWDYLSQAAKQAGIDLEEASTEKDSLSKGIEGIREDTANVLASYINAMRADLSVQLALVGRIAACLERDSSYFALMQADIMLIQMNTLRTANNTDRLVELSKDTYSILRSASTGGSGVKFNIN